MARSHQYFQRIRSSWALFLTGYAIGQFGDVGRPAQDTSIDLTADEFDPRQFRARTSELVLGLDE